MIYMYHDQPVETFKQNFMLSENDKKTHKWLEKRGVTKSVREETKLSSVPTWVNWPQFYKPNLCLTWIALIQIFIKQSLWFSLIQKIVYFRQWNPVRH